MGPGHLGVDATGDRAVARIFVAKGRPGFNPLIVHVPETGRPIAAPSANASDAG